MLRHCTRTDAAPICNIYNYYVRETVVTFEESVVSEVEMARRQSFERSDSSLAAGLT